MNSQIESQKNSYTILIADDEQANLKLLSAIVDRYGYRFATALDGLEAIEKTKGIKPDLILLDVLMPVMDGIEACKRLKEDHDSRHIPVIVLTSFGDKEMKIKCLEAGANDFLAKPVDNTELAVKIRNLLQLKEFEDRNKILTEKIQALESVQKIEEELKASQIELLKKNEELKAITESLGIINLAIDKERMDLQFALDDISYLLKQVADNKDFGVRFHSPDTVTSGHVLKISELFNNMMDILESQHKELEKAFAELKAAQSQILQQDKMASIGQLAAGVAHEINNPVGFIMSNLTSLLKYSDKLSQFIKVQSEAIEGLDVVARSISDEAIPKNKIATPSARNDILNRVDESKKSLKIDYIRDDINNLIKESLDGAERVKKIVQDLKSFSRVDEAEWKITDINEGMESTINIVWNELKYKATVKKEYGDIPSTKCNPGQMNQVFMNILVNAAHAIEKQGEITIKTWYDNGYIYISISDTGKGIPPENLNRIFEPFFTTKEVGKGTGLGLSIAYDIARKHNGDIIVKSEFGKGTTFTVKIPVVEI